MTSKFEPIHRGTLVCVVLKAKNLPNKKSIGKQDPYCTLSLGTSVQKTKPDKRGGQHPTWDEQLHFEIYDDMEDQLKNASDVSESSEATSTSLTSRSKRGKGSKTLKVACYADDAKDPEFIGDGVVDLTDTLKTGEFDEWVTIKAKDRYAGEVYLELTFYSSAVPPKRKKPALAQVPSGTIYGGAGTFSEDFDESGMAPKPIPKEVGHASIPSYMRPDSQSAMRASTSGRLTSNSALSTSGSQAQFDSIPPSQSIPISLRPSSSLAQLDTYTPPYAPPRIQREKSPAPSTYTEHRRMSVPPIVPSSSAHFHAHRLSDAVSPAALPPMQHHYHQNTLVQQQSVDGLIGSISSMSVGSRPGMVDPPINNDDLRYHSQVNGPSQAHTNSPSGNTSHEQHGRPALIASTQSYHTTSSLTPGPTPPPVSTSAPPGVPAYPSHPPIQWQQPGQSNQSFISSPYSHPTPASQMTAQIRSPSPLPNSTVPSRPITVGGYHALPQPPTTGSAQSQQPLSLPSEYGTYNIASTQAAQAADGYHHSYSHSSPSPSHSNRPLPPTNTQQAAPASPSALYSHPPPASYYPPPAQTPSHYTGPPPSMQWPPRHEPAALTTNAYLSYPPPPPGPSNGEYVYPSLQQTSPSSHPGQYPPPPPIHQVDYSQSHPSSAHLQHPYITNHTISQASNDHAPMHNYKTVANSKPMPQGYHHSQAQFP